MLTNVSLTFNTLKVLAMSDEIHRFFEVSSSTQASRENVCCPPRCPQYCSAAWPPWNTAYCGV